MVRKSLVRRVGCVASAAALMGFGLVGTAAASESQPTRQAATHWYMTPNPGNDCSLNIRNSASTGGKIVGHLSSCNRGAWCWYQKSDCGASVKGGTYTCKYADGSSGLRSNEWARVADKNGKLAYVARWCGFAQRL
ncbi:hypothetical protein HEP81_07630 [Streptomyces griseofuscus]|uniref:Secreted protein n=2 Tax=Streptomyces TaxID=1883 RepID=A0A7H1QC32_9ACTN|nr:hypothetical protein HEP81_07630 [Streptomyces griseofuscus]